MVKVRKRREAAPAGRLPTLAFSSAIAVSLAWFGIWFARRRGRPQSEHLPPSAGSTSSR
jgi:hypothetical protein